MSAGTIFAPSWAVSRRNELVEAVYQDNKSSGLLHSDCILLAFARYIEAHEEPPVDPLYEALKAVVELGRYDTREQTQLLRHELTQRGLAITELASKSESLP